MKKYAICFLLLLVLLTACTAGAVDLPNEDGLVADGDVLRLYRNGVPIALFPGIQTVEDKAYYVEADGMTICGLKDALIEKDGQLLYLTEDASLRLFEAGFVTVDGDLYYAPEDGYALLAAHEQVVPMEESLYAFDENCRVMELHAGVQEIFGSLYYVPEDGIAISLPPEGTLLTDSGLYYANADGTLATGVTVGYLTFGADGRYTTGSEKLDGQLEALLADAQVSGTDPIENYRLCYQYLRDHYRYLSMAHYPAGSDNWALPCAEAFFQNGKGNCYCWAGAEMYCARRFGIQAYAVAGWEDSNTNDHAWVMAEIDGTEYLFDAELEYALINIYGSGPVDMFMATPDGGGAYNGFYYIFPQDPKESHL